MSSIYCHLSNLMPVIRPLYFSAQINVINEGQKIRYEKKGNGQIYYSYNYLFDTCIRFLKFQTYKILNLSAKRIFVIFNFLNLQFTENLPKNQHALSHFKSFLYTLLQNHVNPSLEYSLEEFHIFRLGLVCFIY